MSEIDPLILNDFVKESKGLIGPMLELLEGLEGDFSQVQKLADYGNRVDRIMGGAQILAMMVGPGHALHIISDYAAICKAVGYKASQITDNAEFYNICVALLIDATETLERLMDHLNDTTGQLKKEFSSPFLDRLNWVSEKFSADFRSSVGSNSEIEQIGIEGLMKKLGLNKTT